MNGTDILLEITICLLNVTLHRLKKKKQLDIQRKIERKKKERKKEKETEEDADREKQCKQRLKEL